MSGVNVNVLDGSNSRYELHLDSNPLTGVLFFTSHDEKSGGQLVFERDGRRATVNPRAGWFLLFDAREIPHSVTPVNGRRARISAPMNYYFEDDEIERPEALTATCIINSRSRAT